MTQILVVPVHALKACRGSRGAAPAILNLGISWIWVVNFRHRPLYSWVIPRYLPNVGLGEPPEPGSTSVLTRRAWSCHLQSHLRTGTEPAMKWDSWTGRAHVGGCTLCELCCVPNRKAVPWRELWLWQWLRALSQGGKRHPNAKKHTTASGAYHMPNLLLDPSASRWVSALVSFQQVSKGQAAVVWLCDGYSQRDAKGRRRHVHSCRTDVH